jgi:two-component system nitrate/nitrite response regulator NarL
MSCKRIMLVVPGRLFRSGIEHVLQGPDRLIIGDCESFEEVAETLETRPSPDLFVIGVADPEHAAATFAHIRALRAKMPAARWIVLSRSVDVHYLREAIESGIDGMLLEDSPGEALQLLAELVMLGHSFVPAELAKALAGELRRVPPCAAAAPLAPSPRADGAIDMADHQDVTIREARRARINLSDREKQILHCLIAGHPNKQIARDLRISEATVKVHVKGLMRKMQVANRTQAAISALRFLDPADGAIRAAGAVDDLPSSDEPDRDMPPREKMAAVVRLARPDARPVAAAPAGVDARHAAAR